MHTLHGEHIASKYYLVFTGKRQFQRASRAHRDKKLGGVEGSKTPVLTHFDPPHESHAPLLSSDPTPTMVVHLRRGRSGYRLEGSGPWRRVCIREHAYLLVVFV